MFDPKAWYQRMWNEEATGRLFIAGRVTALAVRGFIEDKCVLRASTLTFYTLLSIVPLLATVFGIAKGFGLHRILEQSLTSQVAWQRELTEFLLRFSAAALENARGGLIAGVGVIVFFLSVVGLLGAIEEAFNTVWKVRESRSFGRRFVDYLAIVLIGTVLLAVSAGAGVFVTTRLQTVAQKMEFLPHVSGTVLSLLHLVPFIMNWFLFSFLYVFMPNTTVPFSAAVWAGIVAGTLFQFAQWVYYRFQIGVSSYGAIYGSFAALPLFLVWLQMNWTITLAGCELSYAIVNRRVYGFFPEYSSTGPYVRKVIAAALVREVAAAFVRGEEPPTADELCASLRIPYRFFFPLAAVLVDARLLREARRGREIGYLPGMPAQRLTLEAVYAAFEFRGTVRIPRTAEERVKTAARDMDKVEELACAAARSEAVGEEG